MATEVMDDSVTACVGILKQILPDGLLLQGVAVDNVVATKKVGLAMINIPRLGMSARKYADGNEKIASTESEKYSFEAREYLRENFLGKIVSFVSDFTVPNTKKEIGFMCVGRDWETNLAVDLVAKGLATCRNQHQNEFGEILKAIETEAKNKHLNIWSNKQSLKYDPNSEIDDLEKFCLQNKTKELKAVIEHIRDACSFKILLLNTLQHINVKLAGVANISSQDSSDEAKKYVEARLLQRTVTVKIHVSQSSTAFVTMFNKNMDVALHLLGEGLVNLCYWNLSYIDTKDKYLKADQMAKDRKIGYWSTHSVDKSPTRDDEEFEATIVYVNGTEAITIYKNNEFTQIHLSSIRIERLDQNTLQQIQKNSALQLQVPYEIREYMRKEWVGKKCTILVDYKFKNNSDRLRTCCTVLINKKNIAIDLLNRGYATVQRHRNDDTNRSRDYAILFNAEQERIHLKTPKMQLLPANNVVKLSGEAARSRLGLFRQQKYHRAIVEWVFTASRFNLLVDSTTIITLSLSGLNTFRSDDKDAELADIGQRSLNLMKLKFLQRDAFVRITGLDRSGNCFQGELTLKQDADESAIMLLLQNGYGVLYQHLRKNNSKYLEAENNAKRLNKGIWATNYQIQEEPTKEVIDSELKESKTKDLSTLRTYEAYISNVDGKLNVYLQNAGDVQLANEALIEMSRALNDLESSQDTFKINQLVAVLNNDGESWSRAIVKDKSNDVYCIECRF